MHPSPLTRPRRLRDLAAALVVVLSVTACSNESKMNRHMERGNEYLAEGKIQEATIEFLNVVQINPEHPEANEILGITLFDSGQFAPALNYLQRSAEHSPENAEVRVRLATLYLLRGLREEAREEAGAVLDVDPNNLDALTVFGDTAASAGEIDGAIRRLENARETHQQRAKYHLSLGALHLKKQDTETAEQMFQEAARVEPDVPDAFLALGTFYLAKGEVDTARENFERAAESAPLRSAVQIRVVDFHRLVDDDERANALLAEIVAEAPDFVPAWTRIAGYAFEDKDYDRAEEATNRLLESNPRDPEALRVLGEIYLARGDRAAAYEKYRESITVLQDYVRRRPDLAYAHFRLAQLHIRVEEIAQAMTSLERVIQLAPNSPQASILLAELRIRAGQNDQAIPILEDVLSRSDNSVGWKLLGMAHGAERDFDDAAVAFENFARLEPDNPEAPYRYGTALMGLERRQEARQHFEQALELDPDYIEPLAALAVLGVSTNDIPGAISRVQQQMARAGETGEHHLLLGQLHQAAGDVDRSEAAFRKSVELDPQLTAGYAKLAGLYVERGQESVALEEMKRALTHNRDNVGLMMMKGVLEQQGGDIETATMTYERLLEVNPSHAPAANNLAYLYEREGRYDEALRWAEVARAQSPDSPDIADTLGWIFYRKETYNRALALLKEAYAARPDHAEIAYHLGLAHHKMGEFKETIDVLSRALELDPNSPFADEARTVLDELR